MLILGDSAAQQGISPRELEKRGVPRALNVALQSGSGLFARSLSREVAGQPNVVVYAGVPIEPFDVPPLQREEREHASLRELWLSRQLDTDALFARASTFYRQRPFFFPALISKVSRQAQEQPATALDDAGFLRVSERAAITPAAQKTAAEKKAKIWFSNGIPSTMLRFEALRQAMTAWGADTRRAMLVMPISSPLRNLLFNAISESEIEQRWLAVAEAVDAHLLYCIDALPDSAFWDDDHMTGESGEAFSRTVGPWLLSIRDGIPQPTIPSCEVLR